MVFHLHKFVVKGQVLISACPLRVLLTPTGVMCVNKGPPSNPELSSLRAPWKHKRLFPGASKDLLLKSTASTIRGQASVLATFFPFQWNKTSTNKSPALPLMSPCPLVWLGRAGQHQFLPEKWQKMPGTAQGGGEGMREGWGRLCCGGCEMRPSEALLGGCSELLEVFPSLGDFMIPWSPPCPEQPWRLFLLLSGEDSLWDQLRQGLEQPGEVEVQWDELQGPFQLKPLWDFKISPNSEWSTPPNLSESKTRGELLILVEHSPPPPSVCCFIPVLSLDVSDKQMTNSSSPWAGMLLSQQLPKKSASWHRTWWDVTQHSLKGAWTSIIQCRLRLVQPHKPTG